VVRHFIRLSLDHGSDIPNPMSRACSAGRFLSLLCDMGLCGNGIIHCILPTSCPLTGRPGTLRKLSALQPTP
jgi:hypothetical protein